MDSALFCLTARLGWRGPLRRGGFRRGRPLARGFLRLGFLFVSDGLRLRRQCDEGGGDQGQRELHAALSFLIGRTLSAETISAISLWMKRAVIGVPSKCRIEIRLAGLMPASLTSRVFSCASRFCSITNTLECDWTKS